MASTSSFRHDHSNSDMSHLDMASVSWKLVFKNGNLTTKLQSYKICPCRFCMCGKYEAVAENRSSGISELIGCFQEIAGTWKMVLVFHGKTEREGPWKSFDESPCCYCRCGRCGVGWKMPSPQFPHLNDFFAFLPSPPGFSQLEKQGVKERNGDSRELSSIEDSIVPGNFSHELGQPVNDQLGLTMADEAQAADGSLNQIATSTLPKLASVEQDHQTGSLEDDAVAFILKSVTASRQSSTRISSDPIDIESLISGKPASMSDDESDSHQDPESLLESGNVPSIPEEIGRRLHQTNVSTDPTFQNAVSEMPGSEESDHLLEEKGKGNNDETWSAEIETTSLKMRFRRGEREKIRQRRPHSGSRHLESSQHYATSSTQDGNGAGNESEAQLLPEIPMPETNQALPAQKPSSNETGLYDVYDDTATTLEELYDDDVSESIQDLPEGSVNSHVPNKNGGDAEHRQLNGDNATEPKICSVQDFAGEIEFSEIAAASTSAVVEENQENLEETEKMGSITDDNDGSRPVFCGHCMKCEGLLEKLPINDDDYMFYCAMCDLHYLDSGEDNCNDKTTSLPVVDHQISNESYLDCMETDVGMTEGCNPSSDTRSNSPGPGAVSHELSLKISTLVEELAEIYNADESPSPSHLDESFDEDFVAEDEVRTQVLDTLNVHVTSIQSTGTSDVCESAEPYSSSPEELLEQAEHVSAGLEQIDVPCDQGDENKKTSEPDPVTGNTGKICSPGPWLAQSSTKLQVSAEVENADKEKERELPLAGAGCDRASSPEGNDEINGPAMELMADAVAENWEIMQEERLKVQPNSRQMRPRTSSKNVPRNKSAEVEGWCQQCGKLFKGRKTLNRHLKEKHDPTKQFPCALCKIRFETGTKLNHHLKSHRDVAEHYKCNQCDEICSTLPAMIIHKEAHSGERFYTCNDCEKSFSNYHRLTVHRRIHTGERPYKCVYCKKTFTQLCHKNQHELVHTGEKPYKCAYCEKKFNQVANRNTHQYTHTGENPYRDYKRPKRSKPLAVSKRTPGKPFKCNQCIKRFTAKSSLRRHQRSTHRSTSTQSSTKP